MDIKYILTDFIRCGGNLRKFILNRLASFDSMGYVMLPKHGFVVCDGELWYNVDSFKWQIFEEVKKEYDVSDIRKTDSVLDLGANVGYFSLLASKLTSGRIYAVEPLFDVEMFDNVTLNALTNRVDIYKVAISQYPAIEISFGGKCTTVEGMTFRDVLYKINRPIDVLKCDIEGAEWGISETEFKQSGIRVIEMELHHNGSKTQFRSQTHEYVTRLRNAGYDVNVSSRSNTTCILHARRCEK